MRRASNVDSNQKEIASTFRKLGFTVAHLHTVGKGVPDLIIGKWGVNMLVEVKSEGGKLNKDQERWHETWRGSVYVAETEEDCINIMNKAWRLSR